MATFTPNMSRSRLTPEEEERRRRNMPYAPSMTGQSEQRIEQAIMRANVAGEDPVEAAQAAEGSAPDPRAISTMLRAPMSDTRPGMSGASSFQLRAPMTDAPRINADVERAAMSLRAPAVASSSNVPTSTFEGRDLGTGTAMQDDQSRQLDERDRTRSRRMAGVGMGLSALGTILGVAGAASGREGLMRAGQGIMAGGAAIPAQAPLERIEARATERTAVQEAAQALADRERTRRFEDEDRLIAGDERGLDRDYRQTLMRSMDVNANRREFEMGRVGHREERNYDPASPLAAARRSFLQRLIATNDVTQAAFGGMDLSQMGARDLQQLADQVARRLNAVPNRDRGVDDDALAAIVAGLDEDAADPESAKPAAPPLDVAPVSPVQQAAEVVRRQRARTPRPAAVAPAAPVDGTASSFMAGVNGEPAAPAQAPAAAPAAPRRDRTLPQMYADYIANRRGIALPSGRERFDDFTPAEIEAISRGASARGAGVRDMAAALAGTGGRSQEFAVNQPQTQAFTQADVSRIRAPYSQASTLARDINATLAEYDRMAGGRGQHISQAQFEAMQRGGAISRIMNAERLSALTRSFTNAQLRNMSGAAVTDSEAARFFAALNMNSLNSPQAFREALARARRAALNDLETLERSNPGAYAHIRGAR